MLATRTRSSLCTSRQACPELVTLSHKVPHHFTRPAAWCPSQASIAACSHRFLISGLRGKLCTVHASSPDTEEARSPADAPQEWEVPQPSRRPDIFPEFEKMDRVFLPKPLPGDPEMPDEEDEENRKRTTPGDPDPESKPGEPPEPEEIPDSPGQAPEKPGTDIPTNPE